MMVAANNIAKVITNTLLIIFLSLLVFDFIPMLIHNNFLILLCNFSVNFGQIHKLVIL